MTQEALKLALEALEKTKDLAFYVDSRQGRELIAAIKEALAQKQEPWCMKMNGCKTKCEDCPDEPPQRTWVDLTDKEIIEIFTTTKLRAQAIQMTEIKLKEKNT
jgi:hypothetical protein